MKDFPVEASKDIGSFIATGRLSLTLTPLNTLAKPPCPISSISLQFIANSGGKEVKDNGFGVKSEGCFISSGSIVLDKSPFVIVNISSNVCLYWLLNLSSNSITISIGSFPFTFGFI